MRFYGRNLFIKLILIFVGKIAFEIWKYLYQLQRNYLLCNNSLYAACMTQSQLECKTIACKFANIAYNLQQVQLR